MESLNDISSAGDVVLLFVALSVGVVWGWIAKVVSDALVSFADMGNARKNGDTGRHGSGRQRTDRSGISEQEREDESVKTAAEHPHCGMGNGMQRAAGALRCGIAIVVMVCAAAGSAVLADWVPSGYTRIDCERQARQEVKLGAGLRYALVGRCGAVEIDGANGNVMIESADAVEVDGKGNGIVIGRVGRLEVDGLNNAIEARSVERTLEVDGVNNLICYGYARNVASGGLGNKVRRDSECGLAIAAKDESRSVSNSTAKSAAPELGSGVGASPTSSATRWSNDCPDNGVVQISGVGTVVSITGPCAEVIVSSVGANVSVRDADRVTVTGTGNLVTIRGRSRSGGKTTVVDKGIGNNIQGR